MCEYWRCFEACQWIEYNKINWNKSESECVLILFVNKVNIFCVLLGNIFIFFFSHLHFLVDSNFSMNFWNDFNKLFMMMSLKHWLRTGVSIHHICLENSIKHFQICFPYNKISKIWPHNEVSVFFKYQFCSLTDFNTIWGSFV